MNSAARLGSFVLCLLPTLVLGHGIASNPDPGDRAIAFPDTASHQTLVVDLHTHTVFSDGHVWPRTRVAEALRDGLDAIAITDHLEWQPHLADIPHPDRNRSYDIAVESLGDAQLIVIRGSEITRDAPAGHMNAVFITDANPLVRPPVPTEPYDPRTYFQQAGEWPAQEAVQVANAQNAFVFWNHPYWTRPNPNGIAEMNDFHRANARKGLLHGIEIANGDTYSEEAFEIALDNDLVPIGVSDVHNLIDWDYEPHNGGHRPVNLVFATARTPDAIKEALFAGRTVVWFKNLLLGRRDHLRALLKASLSVSGSGYLGETAVAQLTIHNVSDARFLLKNRTKRTFMGSADLIEVPPHASVEVQFKPGKRVETLTLEFDVINALTAPKRPARLTFEIACGQGGMDTCR